MKMSAIVDTLLRTPEPSHPESLARWKQDYRDTWETFPSPWSAALAGGYRAGCVGYAFASGYQSALRALVPGLSSAEFCALCVTETGGNHPRAIESTLESRDGSLVLTGSKTFTTGGAQADTLLVAARAGEGADGLPQLKMVRVSREQPGLRIEAMPPLPFVPEIDHAGVHFEGVCCAAANLLPGDGYANYVKPFRTIEDVHVSLAVSGFLLRTCAALQLSPSRLESVLACIATHVALAQDDPSSASTHLALAGARGQLEGLLPSLEDEWSQRDIESFELWQRDKALLDIAGKAREARAKRARERLNATEG
jgi:hypothetical protein